MPFRPGNSKNVINAEIVAKEKGVEVVSLTGQEGGKLAQVATTAIKAPSSDTYRI